VVWLSTQSRKKAQSIGLVIEYRSFIVDLLGMGECEVTENIRPVDRSVGRRVRMVRVSRGLSQGALASQLGLTFQQLQKYERGTNRISASKLHDIARILGVEVVSFFEDAAHPDKLAGIANTEMPRRIDLLVAQKLSELPEGRLKEHLTALIFTLAKKPVPVETPAASD
jgi:transcriptional regulator with XRE-family HTH domain